MRTDPIAITLLRRTRHESVEIVGEDAEHDVHGLLDLRRVLETGLGLVGRGSGCERKGCAPTITLTRLSRSKASAETETETKSGVEIAAFHFVTIEYLYVCTGVLR